MPNSMYLTPDQVWSCDVGAQVGNPRPGDFILTRRRGLSSWLISFGQQLRFPKPYAHWSHVALVVDRGGNIVEALTRGVVTNHISKYKDVEYVYVAIHANAHDRKQMARFGISCTGERYGWSTIISLFLTLAVGAKWNLGADAHTICSGLVARAHERGNAIFDREPQRIMPADLARYYKVER